MTRTEVMQILAVLKAAFPHSYKGMSKRDAEALVNLWLRQFGEEDSGEVGAAVDCLIATRTEGYTPTIGEIREQLHRIRKRGELSDSEAWFLVSKACKNGLYGYVEEFEKLPENVKAAIGGPDQLRAWAEMDSETVESVVASNFRKTYRAIQQREKEKALMPPNVKEVLSGIADKMMIQEPKREELMPPKLEPLKRIESSLQMVSCQKLPAYCPPDPESWETRRAAALAALTGETA